MPSLTRTEARVAGLLAAGCTVSEIAASLELRPKTIEGHRARIYRKLGVTSRAELDAQLHASSTAVGRRRSQFEPNGPLTSGGQTIFDAAVRRGSARAAGGTAGGSQ